MTTRPSRPRRVFGTLASVCLLTSAGLALAGPLQADQLAPGELDGADLDALTVTYQPGVLELGARDTSGATVDTLTTTVLVTEPALEVGIDTDLLPYGVLVDDEITVALTGVDGPGEVVVATTTEGDTPLLSSGDAALGTAVVPVGSVLPASFGFTEPGDYAVTLTAGADLDGGEPLAADAVEVRFRVTDDGAQPSASPDPSTSLSPTGEPTAAPVEPSATPAPTRKPSPEPAPRPSSTADAVAPTPERPSPTPGGEEPLPDASEPGSAPPGVEPSSSPTADPDVAPDDAPGDAPGDASTAPDGPPDGALPAPDTAELTADTKNDVELSSDTVAPGSLLTVTLPDELRGQWVSAWVLSTPTDLGWKQVNAQNAVTVALPADFEVGKHRVVVRQTSADLVGWSPLKVASEDEAPEECTAQEVEGTVAAGEADVVVEGHFDFGPVMEGGTMRALVKDDRTQPVKWVDPAALVFHLTDDAAVQAPGGEFDFLGSGQVWQIPLTQAPGVPWLGWNTQHQTIAGHVDGDATLTLENLEGPGELGVYTMGSFGNLGEKYFGTMEGFGRSTDITVGTSGVHVHAIWAFTEPGAYYATMTYSATVDGEPESATAVLTFFVGPGDAAGAARAATSTQTVGVTPDGEECELPATGGGESGGSESGGGESGGGESGSGTLPQTGVDATDLAGLAVAFLLVGLAFVGAAALAPRHAPQPAAAS